MATSFEDQLADALRGFDALFGDDITKAKEILSAKTSPFHELGLGTVIFLQAALGMEDGIMVEASKALSDAEANAKQALRNAPKRATTRFAAGMEWEVLQADAVVLLGLTQALSESYMGYVKCLYSLNSAHGSFTKIYKRVFPNGIDHYKPMSNIPTPTKSSAPASSASSTSGRSFLGRLTGGSTTSSASSSPNATPATIKPEGPVEELIFYGSAFGFGLFNLVFSLLPNRVRRLVGWFGFQSDRNLALEALAVAAAGKDVHSNFAALTLLTYHGLKLLLSGYIAKEAELIQQLSTMLSSLEERFPHGSLWLLNRAKLYRYSNRPVDAITTLQNGLGPSRPVKFKQADALLNFELAWVLVSERRYKKSSDCWLRMTELNTWSHATYTYLAAGCHLALRTPEGIARAQELYDAVPALLNVRKVGGRDLPTEVYIQKKFDLWKRKLARWVASGKVPSSTHFAQVIRVNPAEELGIFWNTQGRIPQETAIAHVNELLTLTPPVQIASPYSALDAATAPENVDLDAPDEFAVRDLLLGVTHRAAGAYEPAREFLESASTYKDQIEAKWVTGVAYFELAVLDMREVASEENNLAGPDGSSSQALKTRWQAAITVATKHLDLAATSMGDTDLSSRLESRIAMLRDELALKLNMIS